MYTLYILTFSRFLIGLIFAFSVFGKITNISSFQQAVTAFALLPPKLSPLTAYIFLTSEFCILILLILGGPFLSIGFLFASLLLLVFTIALLSVLRRKIQTSCNCFGANNNPVTIYDIWRNYAIILCAMVGMAISLMPNSSKGNLNLVEVLFLALIAGGLVTVLTRLSDITEIFRKA